MDELNVVDREQSCALVALDSYERIDLSAWSLDSRPLRQEGAPSLLRRGGGDRIGSIQGRPGGQSSAGTTHLPGYRLGLDLDGQRGEIVVHRWSVRRRSPGREDRDQVERKSIKAFASRKCALLMADLQGGTWKAFVRLRPQLASD